MDPLIEEYLGGLRNGGTAQIYRHALTEFCGWYAQTRGSEVDWDAVYPEIVEEYADYLRSARGLSASTVAGHSAAIAGFLRFRENRATRDSAPGLRFSLWLERQVLRRDDVGRVARQHVWSGHWAERTANAHDDWPDWVGCTLDWMDDPDGRALWAAWCEYKGLGHIGKSIEHRGQVVRVDAGAVVTAGRNGPEAHVVSVCPFCGLPHAYELTTGTVPWVGALVEFTDGEAKELGVRLELRVNLVQLAPELEGGDDDCRGEHALPL